jgi:UPF0716 family protein affecting phage T7 exclusion
MKLIFNLILIIGALMIFVPSFRKFMFWLLVGRQLVKQQKKADKQDQRREGEIKVEKRNDTNTKTNFRGGEYVDYEEVKD